MKIYVKHNEEIPNVELLLNYEELKGLICALNQFERKIDAYKIKNKGKKDLGFTHMHLKDFVRLKEDGGDDVVFYVDLNDKEDKAP